MTRRNSPRAVLFIALALVGSSAARYQGTRPPAPSDPCARLTCEEGGVIRGPLDRREMALVFTGGDFSDGGPQIRAVLKARRIRAAFFFTGDFYRTPGNRDLIRGLRDDGHLLGPHSDKHLLYCDWTDRQKTLVTREEFTADLQANFRAMEAFGIERTAVPCFIPPYEWYNREISAWARSLGLVLFNFSPGTTSNADYTTPSMPEYLDSATIFGNILAWERKDPHGFNGFILLIHVGTDPERKDKFYALLDPLLDELSARGYAFLRVDELLVCHQSSVIGQRGPCR
jgi:peptidoglycan/xylan/chitin deacetylase (PgdA/CDA1 family)